MMTTIVNGIVKIVVDLSESYTDDYSQNECYLQLHHQAEFQQNYYLMHAHAQQGIE